MKKIITLIFTVLLLSNISLADDTCSKYGTHDYRTLICPLVKVCECGSIKGEHDFDENGKCTSCETLKSEEVEDENPKCSVCNVELVEYEENGISGYKCPTVGCTYWSVGSSESTCNECGSALDWTTSENVGACICSNCNAIISSVASCSSCGKVVTPEIVKGYVVFSCCNIVDSSICIDTIIEQCSKESGMVSGHTWKNQVMKNDGVTSYYIVCIDCCRIIEILDMITTTTSNGSVETVPVEHNELYMFYCNCGDVGLIDDYWYYTDTVHYRICNLCGATKQSDTHKYMNGKCTVCLKEDDENSDPAMCQCENATEVYGEYNGWFANSTYHYTLCKKCNKIVKKGIHNLVNNKCSACEINLSNINDKETCNHPNEYQSREYNYTHEIEIDAGIHFYRVKCLKCGYMFDGRIEEPCSDSNSDKVCDICGNNIDTLGETRCKHGELKITYEEIGSYTRHKIIKKCPSGVCNSEEIVAHTSPENTIYYATDNPDGHYVLLCSDCFQMVLEPHDDIKECSICHTTRHDKYVYKKSLCDKHEYEYDRSSISSSSYHRLVVTCKNVGCELYEWKNEEHVPTANFKENTTFDSTRSYTEHFTKVCQYCDYEEAQSHIWTSNNTCVMCGVAKKDVEKLVDNNEVKNCTRHEFEDVNSETHECEEMDDISVHRVLRKCKNCPYIDRTQTAPHIPFHDGIDKEYPIINSQEHYVRICMECSQVKPEKHNLSRQCECGMKYGDSIFTHEHELQIDVVSLGENEHQEDIWCPTCKLHFGRRNREEHRIVSPENATSFRFDAQVSTRQHFYNACSKCNYELMADHVIVDDVCVKCGAVNDNLNNYVQECEHDLAFKYKEQGENGHLVTEYCTKCVYEYSYSEAHKPLTYKITYETNQNGHYYALCQHCTAKGFEAHTPPEGDEYIDSMYSDGKHWIKVCTVCNRTEDVGANHQWEISTNENNKERHVLYCKMCSERKSEDHSFGIGNNECVCGIKKCQVTGLHKYEFEYARTIGSFQYHRSTYKCTICNGVKEKDESHLLDYSISYGDCVFECKTCRARITEHNFEYYSGYNYCTRCGLTEYN